MPAALATCALLFALGLPGVVLLERLTDRFTTLERWAYGLPLGMVVGTLVMLVAAVAVGSLPTALVVTVGAGSLGVALAGAGWTLRERAGPCALLRPLPAVVLGVFAVRWAFLWKGSLTGDEDGLWAGQINIWGDWALHLGDVTSFVYGENFPPENSRYAGGPLAYHYLTSVTCAAGVRLGLEPADALALHSFVGCVLVLLGLFAFALRLTHDREAAAVAIGLFLLGGSLGWLLIARDAINSDGALAFVRDHPWDQGVANEAGFEWQNMFFALIEPQRGYLYGLPLAMLVLTLLLLGVERWQRRLFAVAGLVAGTLPFAHTSTLVALALITPFVAVLFRTGLKAWLVSWSLFFGLWIVTAVPQIYLQQGGERGETSAIRWQVGWLTHGTPDSWLWFWVESLGFFLPLSGVALARRSLLPPDPTRLIWAFMPTFVLCNLIVFRPWDWDNTKFFLYWFLAVSVLVGKLLTDFWRARRSQIARALVVASVTTMVASGLLVNYQQMAGLDRHQMLSADEVRVARQVRESTQARSTFAVAFQHNHPVPVLAGRRVVMSFTGWLFAFGIDYAERERDVRSIYALGPDTPALLAKYDVDYVVIGPGERQTFSPDVEAFRARFGRIVDTGGYEIFDVR